jgi:dihydroorotase
MDPRKTAEFAQNNPDIIVGIKLAHYNGYEWAPTDSTSKAGKLANLPVMIDFGGSNPPLSIEELFTGHLKPGDIFTHCYASLTSREAIVDKDGKVKPFVFAARDKGILFDVGHGGGSFRWSQAIPAIRQGLVANTISSDLHIGSMNGGMKDMANLMSKFLNLGLSIRDVILRSTWNPAKVINHPELGNLSVGSEADIAIFSLRKGDFGFTDIGEEKIKGTQKLEAEMTIRAGKIVWDLNGLGATKIEF